jgi:hypothetical protein
MLTTGSGSGSFALETGSTSVLSQRINNPDHALRVLSAVPLKLLPHFPVLSLRHVAEVNPQVFQACLPALLNFQIGVAAAR